MADTRFDPPPPPQASRYLRNKELTPSFDWQDVAAEEHAAAFAVAKATRIDVLRTIHEGLQKALDEGRSFDSFKKELTPELQRLGWWGKDVPVIAPDGSVAEVTLGTPQRLRVIYDTNMRTARAAGQWERIQRTKEALPYLTYRLGPSERHRPGHVAKEGLTLRVDDPFWQTWYPPNGWGCKCWVRQISAAEAERLGIDEPPEINTTEWENPRTGETRDVPNGIDPGWEMNPGAIRARHVERLLQEKLMAAPRDIQKTALRDIAMSDHVARLATQDLPGNAPIGILPAELRGQNLAPTPVVEFSAATRQHVFEDHPERRVSDLRFLADLDEAPRVALQERPGEARRLIFELDAGDSSSADRYDRLPLRVVLVTKPAGTFVNTIFRTQSDRWDKLVARDGVTVLRDAYK